MWKSEHRSIILDQNLDPQYRSYYYSSWIDWWKGNYEEEKLFKEAQRNAHQCLQKNYLTNRNRGELNEKFLQVVRIKFNDPNKAEALEVYREISKECDKDIKRKQPVLKNKTKQLPPAFDNITERIIGEVRQSIIRQSSPAKIDGTTMQLAKTIPVSDGKLQVDNSTILTALEVVFAAKTPEEKRKFLIFLQNALHYLPDSADIRNILDMKSVDGDANEFRGELMKWMSKQIEQLKLTTITPEYIKCKSYQLVKPVPRSCIGTSNTQICIQTRREWFEKLMEAYLCLDLLI